MLAVASNFRDISFPALDSLLLFIVPSSNNFMLKRVLIHDNLLLYNRTGELVILEVLKITETRSHDNCFGHKMKGLYQRHK